MYWIKKSSLDNANVSGKRYLKKMVRALQKSLSKSYNNVRDTFYTKVIFSFKFLVLNVLNFSRKIFLFYVVSKIRHIRNQNIVLLFRAQNWEDFFISCTLSKLKFIILATLSKVKLMKRLDILAMNLKYIDFQIINL